MPRASGNGLIHINQPFHIQQQLTMITRRGLRNRLQALIHRARHINAQPETILEQFDVLDDLWGEYWQIHDIINIPLPPGVSAQAAEQRERLLQLVQDVEDALLEKYFELVDALLVDGS
eukprot:gene3292-3568_t